MYHVLKDDGLLFVISFIRWCSSILHEILNVRMSSISDSDPMAINFLLFYHINGDIT